MEPMEILTRKQAKKQLKHHTSQELKQDYEGEEEYRREVTGPEKRQKIRRLGVIRAELKNKPMGKKYHALNIAEANMLDEIARHRLMMKNLKTVTTEAKKKYKKINKQGTIPPPKKS